MDQCTHDVRSARWKQILHECQQRPAGISVKQWLKENHILEQSYYYWQRKFRKEAYDKREFLSTVRSGHYQRCLIRRGISTCSSGSSYGT